MTVETKQGNLWINGKWVATEQTMEVLNKYTQQVEATIAVAQRENIAEAVDGAKKAQLQSFSPYERYTVLKRASELLRERSEEFAKQLAIEVGKPIVEARGEAARAAMTLEISAEEAKRIQGHGVAVESAPGSENRRAFTRRVPVGVIAAITPFNVPLNLVCHKIGPALAAGNSVVLKPAEVTPLCALMLAELFEEAGLPAGRLQIVTGHGPDIGQWLVDHEEVDMFTFTGSPRVGKWLLEHAGIRKVSLELGNNSATVVHADANVDEAAKQVALKSFNNAGQVCISVQRVYVHEEIEEQFLQKVKAYTEELVVGDPLDERTYVGPMIRVEEAIRVEEWVREAVEEGAEIVTGGTREGALFQPTILHRTQAKMQVICKEVFGPVVSIQSYKDEDEVIQLMNDSPYGLQAGLFTNSLSFAMKASEQIEVGGLIINDTSGYRVDHMPYGGMKQSGHGKEGPRYAIEEMTYERIIVMNL